MYRPQRPSPAECRDAKAVLDAAWEAATFNHGRIHESGMGPLDKDIRALCWHLIPGKWEDNGNGNKLVWNGRELLAYASGYPRPTNMGASIHTVGEPLWKGAHFHEYLQSADEFTLEEQYAWLVGSLRRAGEALFSYRPPSIPRMRLLMGEE